MTMFLTLRGVLRFVLLVSSLPTRLCFPSFRNHIPNGVRVQCPPGGEGCSDGDASLGEPGSLCSGVGHATCSGGDFPLNPFGQAMAAHGYTWTRELCEADSDGDGLTNGEELGDPCCLWSADDTPSVYTRTHAATHPGVPTDATGYVRPACEETAPLRKAVPMNSFNAGEERRSVAMLIRNLTLPKQRTVYVDIAWNFPDDTEEVFHVVYAEAIVRLKKNLHHFVLRGCAEKWPEDKHGRTVSGTEASLCNENFGGWAPGKNILSIPNFLGRPVGKKAGIVAFVVNVHFDNPDLEEGLVSDDGVRIFYTPTLRDEVISDFATAQISMNPTMVVPPMRKRFFITRSCDLTVMDGAGRPGRLHLSSMYYHAHLLGREMYAELTQGGKTVNLGSEAIWHFDDQYDRNLLPYNVTLETGDRLQTTCVFDSMGRKQGTIMGIETVDEMCWASFVGWPGGLRASCAGSAWNGDLEDGESGLGLALRHPEADAPSVWDMASLRSGGRMIKGNETACFENAALRDRCPLLVGRMQASSQCDADLGVVLPPPIGPRLAGLTVLMVCCPDACAGPCKSHAACRSTTTTTTTSEVAAASRSPAGLVPPVFLGCALLSLLLRALTGGL